MKEKTRLGNLKLFLVFAGPATVLFALVVLVPFLYGIFLTFTNWDGFSSAVDLVGLRNYQALAQDGAFWESLGKTILYVLCSVALINFIAFVLAYLLTSGLRGQGVMRSAFFTPNLIGGIILGFIWQFIFQIVFSQILFGPDSFLSIPFLQNMTQDNTKALFALAILVTWQMAGYMMIIYITGLNNIPFDLYEAAEIDGASAPQRFRVITLPMLMPAFTVVFFLTLANCFKLLDQNIALTDGAFGTRMLATQILRTIKDTTPPNYGQAQAQAVIFFVLIAVVTLIQVSLTKKREVEL